MKRPLLRRALPLMAAGALAVGVAGAEASEERIGSEPLLEEGENLSETPDSIAATPDSIADVPYWMTEEQMAAIDSDSRYTTLTDGDFRKVAEELGCEAAAVKAVVRIEAGPKMEGFWAPGVPVVNYDKSVSRFCKPASNEKAPASETIPEGITSAYGRKEWGQLVAARKVNRDKANMCTFWGMFQIGGFNYKICGCSTVQEFVDRMSYSEFEQLELFATFVRNSGMLPALQQKNWAAFARKYNGASYAKRGYHTRMAAEYKKFKAQGL